MVAVKKMEKWKTWFENYWYYYKWHTIIALLVIFCLAATIPGLISKDEADLGILLIGDEIMIRDIDQSIQDQAVEGILRDATEDGEIHVFCRLLSFTGEDAEDYYTFQSLSVDLAAGNSRVFIFEKEYLKYFSEEEVLRPLSGNREGGLYDEAGNFVAAPLKNTALANNMGIILPEEAYVAVRAVTPTEEKKKHIDEKEENAIRLFDELTK